MHEAEISLNKYGTRAKPIQIGERFGRLVVVAEAAPGRNKAGHSVRRLLCRCDCGVEKVKEPKYLRSGGARSCGCLQRETARKISTKHGGTAGYRKHPLYWTWLQIRSRCRNPKNGRFEYYGGRGIDVCDRWFGSFSAFVEDMGPRPTAGHTVDRIDNDKGYEPTNCRWADKTTQARNTRRNRVINVRGEKVVLAALAERLGMNETSIRLRIERGWDMANIDAPKMTRSAAAKTASDARWSRERRPA